jgi:quercetin dioxygenase-like cupin family protein
MKLTVMLGLTIVAATPLVAQNYPHAFPRTGVKKLFENERVVAWDVTWLTGVEQPIHRHQYDMAAVYLRYGPIRVTAPDGTVSPQGAPFDVPRPFFQAKNVTHREEAIGFPPGTPERMAIMFDLKEVSAPAVPAPKGVPTAFPRPGALTPAIDNARVLEWDYTWTPGAKVPLHIHDRDSVQVFQTGGTIRFTAQDGKSETKTFAMKDARFIPRGTIDAEEALDGSPRAVTIELR